VTFPLLCTIVGKIFFSATKRTTMDNLTNILLWTGMIAGGLLIILLLLSILSGFDLDGDLDVGHGVDGDGDADTGGLGIIKSGLTFFSIASFTARAIVLNSDWSWTIALTSGIIAGIIAIFILSQFFKLLLRQQEEGNYELWEAVGKTGRVYVPIPKNGTGRITIEINGVDRELPAKEESGKALSTNTKVMVTNTEDDCLVVVRI